jgi:hypothetical protein
MILNYRTYFRTEQKTKIINDYLKYIINKTDHHKSDLAIGHNIIKNVFVDSTSEKIIIDFRIFKDFVGTKIIEQEEIMGINNLAKSDLIRNFVNQDGHIVENSLKEECVTEGGDLLKIDTKRRM